MNKGIYHKLAFQSIRKNYNIYFPFLLSATVMVAMFYILSGITIEVSKETFVGSSSMLILLELGQKICGFFSALILFYTNRFLMKKQSKEFGLYSMLGMEKRHIMRVVLWETAGMGLFCIAVGILSGMLFSRLLFMVLLKLLHLSTKLHFSIEGQAIVWTLILYAVVFLLLLVVNCIRVLRLKPIELMNEGRAGEKEPKAKWFLALLGIISLGAGYFIALTTENPIQAMNWFFIAVLLVIIGTYLLFMSGSIAFLKLLKANKKYYYQKDHFITVSGLMYRMKQNAQGLASICILSTAVLVVLSTTSCLYASMDEILDTRFPRDVMVDFIYDAFDPEEGLPEGTHYDYSQVEAATKKMAHEKNLEVTDEEGSYQFFYMVQRVEDTYTINITDFNQITQITVISLEDYNRITKSEETLNPNEVLVWGGEDESVENKIILEDKSYDVKKHIKEEPEFVTGGTLAGIYGGFYLVVPSLDEIVDVYKYINSKCQDGYYNIYYCYQYNLKGKNEDKMSFCNEIRDAYLQTGIAHTANLDNRYTSQQDFYDIYGSLLFIGLFIGGLFLMTTVMIIYYKQISEGYDDRERFMIMQKVGMSDVEVKRVIRHQILLVFFLPILLAIVHIAFALDIIRSLLSMFYMADIKLYIISTLLTIVVFFVVYALIYGITAKQYYKITSMKA